MSSILWADAPTPVLATEQFPRILAAVIAADPHDRSVLRIFGLAAPTDVEHPPGSRPQIALKLYEGLIQAMLDSGVIYSLRNVRVADDFYVEYLREQRSLWLKYQQILGSRLLIRMTDQQAESFEETIRQLQAPEPAEDAEAEPVSLQGEMALQRAKGQRIELPARRLQHYARIKTLILTAGGVLVSLTSPGWRTGRTIAQRNFRAFVDNIGAEVEALPAGAFKASGTKVSVLRLRAVKQVEGAHQRVHRKG